MPEDQVRMTTGRPRATTSVRSGLINPGLATCSVHSNNLDKASVIFVVTADSDVRACIRDVCRPKGWIVKEFNTSEGFLEVFRPGREACLVLGAHLSGMGNFALLKQLHDGKHRLPSIVIAGNANVSMAVRAMKAGAMDFIEKPLDRYQLGVSIECALEESRAAIALDGWRDDATRRIAGLTTRQRQIMELVLAGHPSKNIATDLGISRRTVENHRASIMRKTAAKSLPLLAGLALAAAGNVGETQFARRDAPITFEQIHPTAVFKPYGARFASR